jgi:hypothetical protein
LRPERLEHPLETLDIAKLGLPLDDERTHRASLTFASRNPRERISELRIERL